MLSGVRFHGARGRGTCPHFYKWGTVRRRTENKKLTKLYWPSRKRSPKRRIVLAAPGGHFDVETRGKAVSIVEKLVAGTHGYGVPILLQCLRTHYGRHCEPFSGPKCIHCIAGFCIYNLKIFRGWYPSPTEAPPPMLETGHQFPLGSLAFPLGHDRWLVEPKKWRGTTKKFVCTFKFVPAPLLSLPVTTNNDK